MLEDEDCPSTYHQPTINLSSSHHQPTINPPSTYHQPDINLPSTSHQPHINPILQGSHLRVKKNRQIVTSFYYIANHKFTFKAYRDLRYLWQWAHNKSKSPMVLVSMIVFSVSLFLVRIRCFRSSICFFLICKRVRIIA